MFYKEIITKHDAIIEYADDRISDYSKLEWFKRVNFSGTTIDKEHLNSFIK